MTIDPKIIERITKLLNLGDKSRNSSEAEAMLALERAYALMREHGLDMADLQQDEDELALEMCSWTDDYKSQYDTWVSILASASAQLFGVNIINRKRREPGMAYAKVAKCFVGEEVDVELVKNVWPYLVKTCRKLARADLGGGWNASHRSYAEGFACRVYERCVDIRTQEEAAARQSNDEQDQKFALVIVAKEHALERYTSELFPNLKEGRKTSLKGQLDYGAMLAGQGAGDQVNLNFRRQVGTSQRSKPGLLT
jgi:hypothetical protein